MKKSVADWSKKYDDAKGNAYEKTIALFQEYAGACVSYSGAVYVSKLSLFFAGSWGRNYTDVVASAIAEHLKEDQSIASRNVILTEEARQPAYIIYLVRQALAQQNKQMDPDGDLSNLIKALMQKNNLTEDAIKDLAGPKMKEIVM